MQKIEKIKPARFKLWWTEYSLEVIYLDFNPLITRFNLIEKYTNFALLHWQARPKGLRRFGVYFSENDEYKGLDFDKIKVEGMNMECLQVPESSVKTLPTAVLCYPNYQIREEENDLIILLKK